MDKKVTTSLTLIGSFGAVLIQTLMGFDVLPAGGEDAASGILGNLTELVRNVFALVAVYGARRAVGEVLVATKQS